MSELLTISEVAQILRVDHSTVRRWARDGALLPDDIVVLPRSGGRKVYRVKRRAVNRVLGVA